MLPTVAAVAVVIVVAADNIMIQGVSQEQSSILELESGALVILMYAEQYLTNKCQKARLSCIIGGETSLSK